MNNLTPTDFPDANDHLFDIMKEATEIAKMNDLTNEVLDQLLLEE